MMSDFWKNVVQARKRSRRREKLMQKTLERLEERCMLTDWNGVIPDGTVWPANQVQVITGDVDVPAGSTLTIQPGAIIKMNTYFRNFIVDGTVLAQGTQASPIIFTEIHDDVGGDTNGDGTSSSPSNNNWGVLQFNASSTGCILDHVDIRYGGHNGKGDVYVNGGQLTLTNSTVENSGSMGVRIEKSHPTLTNITYQNNSGAALSMDLASNPAISGVVVAHNSVNGLVLDSGTLSGDGVWDDPDVVYWFNDDITVPLGTKLTIAAGQVIKRPYFADLFVNGTLTATGTAVAPIVFTEQRDDTAGGDTNNDQSNSSPARGFSNSITFSSTSTANLMDHVEVRYAGHDGTAVLDNGAPLIFTNGVIRESSSYGLRIQSSNPTVTGNELTNNSSGAISMDLASNPTISGNTVTGNGVNGVVLDTGTLVVNSTWNNPDIVYWFTDDITVPVGRTLTISAGQVIKRPYFADLFVNGSLIATGTAAAPIVFTEQRDDTAGGDTNNDQAGSLPARGFSNTITFSNTSTPSLMDHVEIRYAGHDGLVVFDNGAPLTFTNGVIRDSLGTGLRIVSSNATVTGNSFTNIQNGAISMNLASNPTISGNTVTGNGVNGVVLDSGTVSVNATWNNPDIVYWFTDDITVPVGLTLTISAGQVIKRPYFGDLFVNGSLIATGTAAAPIIFTEQRDDTAGGDTNNDQSTSSPARNFSGGIWLSSTSTGNLMDHVEVRYAGRDAPAAVITQGAPLTFTNGAIRDSNSAGLRIQSNNAIVTGNAFTNNSSAAISMDLASNPTITGNTESGNGINGVILDHGNAVVNLTWNNPDIVYVFSDDITIPAGMSLTISAGQVIKRPYFADLVVNGSLNGTGTTNSPIIFTEIRDDTAGGDTNNDQSNSAPASDFSGGIWFTNTSTANVMDHVEVRYAGRDAPGAVVADHAPLTFTNGVIRDSSHAGLRLVSSNAIVTGTTFTNNAQAAVSMDVNSVPQFSNNTETGNGTNGVVLDGGTLLQNAYWNSPDIVYVITDDITIPAGVTLSIGPGQVIKRVYYNDIFVNGTMVATGTASAPVIFTEYRDDSVGGDSNNDQANSVPSSNNGGVIQFSSSSTGNLLDHVEIRYSSRDADGEVVVNGGAATITNGVFRDSTHSAIVVRNGGTATVENSLIYRNPETGIRIESGATVTAINNTIDGNARGVTVDGLSTVVTLTNNLITNNANNGVLVSNRGNVTMAYNDVIQANSNGSYSGLTDQTGQNGNVSVDPQYVNLATRDYHLQATSPVIDAGNSDGAPIDDLDFNLRVDDPDVSNTGIGKSPFFDLGAYEFGGKPEALKSSPSGNVADEVSQIVLTFRGKMDTNSFSPVSDVLGFTGPNGPIIVTGFEWLNPYQLKLTFNTQAKVGTYQLTLGPNILNTDGQPLDTDADGTAGETVDDRFVASWTIVPPKIVSSTPTDYTSAPIDHVDFTFDRSMDTSSFDLSDVVSFTGPNGNLTATGFTWVDSQTLEISFDSQSVLGQYSMVLGPNIADIGGNLLDQNANDIVGEATADQYSADFTLANIFHVSGDITANTTWGGLILVDDNVNVLTGMTLTINPGTIIKFETDKGLVVQAGATLLANGTASQPIRFTSIHDDTVGGDSDRNGNRIGPQAGDWSQIQNSGNATFDHVQVLYGSGIGNTGLNSGAIRNSGGTLSFTNSLISQAFYDGLDSVNGSVTMSNSVIAGADRGVVSTFGGTTITIVNSTFDDNRIGLFAHVGGSISLTNSIVSNSLESGFDTDSGPQTVSDTDVYTTVTNAVNYRGMTNPTGTSGNISADPKFVNALNGSYQLNFGSPAIDAAKGSIAPATDAIGSPRYDDPRTTNTGTITSNNAYADMGAFEFIEGAASNLDLIITSANTNTSALEGDTITVNWTEKNSGTAVATGTWHDAIYLSTDPVLSPDDVLLGDALHTGNLGANQTYSGTANVAIPGALPGQYYVLVRANSDNAVFEGANLTNNVTAASPTIALDVPALTIGGSVTGQIPVSGESQVYKLVVPAGNDVQVSLDGPNGVANELYAKMGDIPTRQMFDARGNVTNQADQTLTLSGQTGGTYYLLVYGANVSVAETFTLTAAVSDYHIDAVSPATGGNTGRVTITFTGANFDSTSHPQLRDASNHVIQPSQMYFVNSSTLMATFDLTGHATGTATAEVVTHNVTASLPNGFMIEAGKGGNLVMNLSAPSAVRVGRDFTFTVEYSNNGDTDLLAPLIEVSTQGLDQIGFEADDSDLTTDLEIIAVSNTGPAGILAPGAQGQIVLHGKSTAGGTDTIELDQAEYPDGPVDWSSLEPTIRPGGLSDSDWNALFAQLKSQIGSQWTDYVAAISRDVTLLPPSDGLNYSLSDVYTLEMDRAKAALSTSVSGHLYLNDVTRPLGDAEVVLTDATHGLAFDTNALTDGSFLFPDIPAGTYQLEVDGFLLPGPVTVTVGANSVSAGNIVANPGASISGNVVINSNGEPLTNTAVFAYSTTGTVYISHLDSNGAYEFNGLPADNYTLKTGGGNIAPASVQVQLADHQDLQHFNISVSEGGAITGKVMDPSGSPVAHATVFTTGTADVGASTTTAADGTFVILGLLPGEYHLSTQASGFAPAISGDINVTANSVTQNVNLTLSIAGGVHGTLTSSADGSPVANTSVSLLSGQTLIASAQTDSTGVYDIVNVMPGTYTVDIRATGFLHSVSTVTVTANQSQTKSVVLTQGGIIQGSITDGTGHPLVNLAVQATAADKSYLTGTTDENGAYRFDGLVLGTYTINIGQGLGASLMSQSATVTAGAIQSTVNFTLPTAGTISGRVFEADGVTPLTGANVSLFLGDQDVLDTSSDDSGNYSFLILQSGTYQIAVNNGSDTFALQSGLNVASGAVLTHVDFSKGQSTVSGSFLDSATQQPIPGGQVSVIQLLPGGALNQLPNETTGQDGSFHVDGLAPGDYQLLLQDGVHATVISTFHVTASIPVAPLNFASGPGNVLTGTLTAANTGLPLGTGQILVYRHSDHALLGTGGTDGQGNYQISGLPDGAYDVVLNPPGFEAQLISDVSVSGGSKTLNGVLANPSASATGTLVSNGQPVGGAQITVADAAGLLSQTVTTDANGNWNVDTLPAGDYLVTAHAQGQSATPKPIAVKAGGGDPPTVIIANPIGDVNRPIAGGTSSEPPPVFDTTLLNMTIQTPRPGCEDDYDNAVELQKQLNNVAQNVVDAKANLDPTVLLFFSLSDETAVNTAVVIGDFASLVTAVRGLFFAFRAAIDGSAFTKALLTLDKGSTALVQSVLKPIVGDDIDALGIKAGLSKVTSDLGNWYTVLQNAPSSLKQASAADIRSIVSAMNGALGLGAGILQVLGKLPALAGRLPVISGIISVMLAPWTISDDIENANKAKTDSLNSYANRLQSYNNAVAQALQVQARFKQALEKLDSCNLKHAPIQGPPRPPDPNPGRKKHPPVKKPVNNPKGGDPNDKIGPAGFGAAGFIEAETMPYKIEFENSVEGGATAPAQVVEITDTLDPNVDPSSVQLTGFGFGQHNVTIPEGLQHYETTIDLRPDGVNLLVPVEIDFNPQTRVLTASFQSIDPVTGLPPDDPYAGFLPIDDASLKGLGYITYTLQPKAGLATGATIDNQASIVFDTNAAILTPTTVNTLDVGGPSSHVVTLAAQVSSANFTVNWTGSDDAGGSGISSYDVYVSDNNGPFTLWQSATALTSAVYPGQFNHTYAFYTIATDNVGHQENKAAAAEATTFVIPNAPPVIDDQSLSAPENSPVNTVIGTVQATDPDVGDTLTFSITGGNAAGAFTINSQTGQISVANASLLDFETHPSWPLTVQVSDNHGATDTATVTVNLTDVNEAPMVANQTFTIAENSATNTVVGTSQGSDPDADHFLTYLLIGGNGAFSINGLTGVISVADSSQVDFETHPTFSLTVQVMDNHGATGTGTVTVNLTDVNDVPQLALNGSAVTFSAKAAKKSGPVHVAPNVTVVDPDQSPANSVGGGTLTVSIDVSAKVAKKGKITMNDTIGGFTGSSLGTATGPTFANNKLTLSVHLSAGTTAAAIQSFLRGITFTSKGAGLKLNHRILTAQLTDAAGASSALLTQTVNVTK